MSDDRKLWFLAIAAALLAVAVFGFAAPLPQDLGYLNFADARSMFGVSNFWNVASNLPFLIFGILGFVEASKASKAFANSREKFAYFAFFATLFMTGLGSGLFHADVNLGTLFWDRLPISLSFMALMAGLLGDRTNEKLSARVLIPFLIVGAASVFVWDWTERHGAGDLRFYALVQFGSMPLLVATMFLFRNRYTEEKWIWAGMCWYVVAKLCELWDRPIYGLLGETWSGHTLKHLAASLAAGRFWIMIKRRRLRAG